jgi:hypothetical protein
MSCYNLLLLLYAKKKKKNDNFIREIQNKVLKIYLVIKY